MLSLVSIVPAESRELPFQSKAVCLGLARVFHVLTCDSCICLQSHMTLVSSIISSRQLSSLFVITDEMSQVHANESVLLVSVIAVHFSGETADVGA